MNSSLDNVAERGLTVMDFQILF